MVSITPDRCKHVFVAFQDSEGFDSGLISDLTSLFQYVPSQAGPRRSFY